MLTMLVHWIIASTMIISYLLDLPNVNCVVTCASQYTLLLGTRLMFLPVVVNRFLHVALPFSYKSTVTTKRVCLTIGSLWYTYLV